MFVCPSVRLWACASATPAVRISIEIWYWGPVWKSVDKVRITLRWDIIWHFTWRLQARLHYWRWYEMFRSRTAVQSEPVLAFSWLHYSFSVTFIGPCFVIYGCSKTNEMHQFLIFFLFCISTLLVSDGLSVQYKESKTVHTASGTCQTDPADCLLAGTRWNWVPFRSS